MIGVTAQVSLYPLAQEPFEPPIDEAIEVFRSHNLGIKVGTLSTLLTGSDDEVLAAVREAFRKAAQRGPAVMVVTLTNAAPPTDEQPSASGE